MNWKTCFLPLLLAAVMLGSVTAFADGEPVTPETTEPTEMETRETEGSWSGNTYTDNQGIVYQLNSDGTITLTNGRSATGSITIPEAIEKGEESYSVTGVGDWAFESCIDLKNVTFSGNVGSIGYFAFWDCTALENVTFSGDVDSIGAFAFWECTVLTTIYVPASMPEETVQIIRDALTGSWLSGVQIVQPEQPSDPDPDTPSDPATDPSTPPDPSTGTPSTPSTGTTSTGSAVQQLEAAERPDPMDVEATERYNFWMDVKSDLRAAENGEKVRVYVPADYTNMPASVMETIRTLEQEVTIDLRWNGQRLIITPQTALQRPARKAFWTFDALCEVYAR